MNQPLLKCEHVDFGYENYDVVKDVSMEINPGDYLCIVGENGSGKSTLMKGLFRTHKAHRRCPDAGGRVETVRNRISPAADPGPEGFSLRRYRRS